MNTVTVWLLIVFSPVNTAVTITRTPSTLERFTSEQECSRVQKVLSESVALPTDRLTVSRCVQATIVVTK